MTTETKKLELPKLDDHADYRVAKAKLEELKALKKTTEDEIINLEAKQERASPRGELDEAATALIAGERVPPSASINSMLRKHKDLSLKLEVIRRAIHQQKGTVRSTGNKVSPELVAPLFDTYNARLRRKALALVELIRAEIATAEVLDGLNTASVHHRFVRLDFPFMILPAYGTPLCDRIGKMLACGALRLNEVNGLCGDKNINRVWQLAAKKAKAK